MNTVRLMSAIFFGRGNRGNFWRRINGRRNLTTMLILNALLFPITAAGQTKPYTVTTSEYSIDLPSQQWRAITLSGADYHRDFRFSEDNDVVRLRIRRDIVDENVSTTDEAERQRRLDRSSKRGYVTGTIEDFEGALSGTRYSYEYVTSGITTARVVYYLRATKRSIYRIEFSGPPKMLLGLADQTQSIARSFRLKSR